jgi:multiple sugar transport system permease protein
MIFVLGPIVASIILSFTKYELFTPPQWVGLSNYKELLFQDPLFPKSLYNTFYYVIFSVPLGVVVSLLLAMLLNQKLVGITWFRTIYYLPAVTSTVAVSLLWLWLFNPQWGLINTLLGMVGIKQGPGWLVDARWSKPALILTSIWGVGGSIVIYLAGLQSVPQQLYEAAEVDGANWWHKFWKITIPMISPVIFFNVIVSTIGAFQVFAQAYIITGGGPVDSTLFYVLYLFRNAFLLLRMGYAAAMAWILFIIVLILTLIQFRFANRWVYYEGGNI